MSKQIIIAACVLFVTLGLLGRAETHGPNAPNSQPDIGVRCAQACLKLAERREVKQHEATGREAPARR